MIPVIEQAQLQAGRHLTNSSYVLVHNTLENWREVYVSLSILIS
jgi:hypothetical protein